MEPGSFADNLQDQLSLIQRRQNLQSQTEALRLQQNRDRAAHLIIARERMRRYCREAAAHLIELGIPIETGRDNVESKKVIPGFQNPTKTFVSPKFPEGWVITRDTTGSATGVLTRDGQWLLLHTASHGTIKAGEISEYPYEREKLYEIDEQGPYLVFNTDQFGEYPPSSREQAFTHQIATLVARYK